MKFIVKEYQNGAWTPRKWKLFINSEVFRIQFFDEGGNEVKINGVPLRLPYQGSANLVGDTRMDISSDGFSLTNSGGLASGTVTDNTQAYFLVIQTNKCNTCVNGKYMLNESIQQIGYFEFKGIRCSSLIHHDRSTLFLSPFSRLFPDY